VAGSARAGGWMSWQDLVVGAPSGTVTFLFTDIEGSTRLWELAPEAMGISVARHDSILRSSIDSHGGYVFSTGGDGFGAAFGRAGDAIAAAVDAQEALDAGVWPTPEPVRVRMGLHTGEAAEREGDYFGPALNRAARLMAVGHGGQILCSSVTAELVEGVELMDLGEHRLRDLSAPLRVLQVGTVAFPALRSLEVFRSNLPASTSVFVGRERELALVASLLAGSRVVTLTGVGGVGKTRLAVQGAAELAAGYRDGAWLVELAPIVGADELVEVVARALRVPDRQGQSLAASVTDFLRGKRLLMVLDNCEHLLDAVAHFVAGVVSACPQVAVLATSREGLGLDGERMLVVPSLGLPAEGADAGVVGEADAVRLFVERAGQVRPEFALSAANAAAVGQLVRRLDGIPLAIELAASRVRSLTPAELAERMDERFRLLAGGRRTAVERHQTLRRAIDWSYELLTEAEKTALNRAAVFADDFSLDAAEAVIADEGIDRFEVDDLLGRLVDKSLIAADDRGAVTRYRLLETIRQYAQEQLENAGEVVVARGRHAAYYAEFTAVAGDGLRGRDEVSWTGRVDAELDNVRAAFAWSVGVGDSGLAMGIVMSLALVGTRTGSMTRAWAAPVVAMPEARAHRLYPPVLALAGYAEAVAGDPAAGMATCRAALELADVIGVDGLVRCRVFGAAVAVAAYVSDFEEMGHLSRRWAEAARGIVDDWELALALVGAAFALLTGGEVGAATACADEALGLARRIGNPTVLSHTALMAGLVRGSTDPTDALRLLAQGLEAAELIGDHIVIGTNLRVQASLRIDRGDWTEAGCLITRSLEHYRHAGAHNLFSEFIGLTALILDAAGDDEASATLHGKAAGIVLHRYEPVWLERQPGSQRSVRRRLGDNRFEDCASRGRAMDIEEVAAYANEKLAHFNAEAD